MIYLFGLAYVALFWFVGFFKPKIALALIFAAAPFQNDIASSIGGGAALGPMAFSMSELNLLLILPVFVLRQRPLRFGPTFWPAAFYLAACTLSSLASWRSTSLATLIQIVMYLMITVMVFTSFVKDPQDFRFLLYCLVGVGVVLGVAVITSRSGYVLNLHKNGVGSSLAAVSIVNAELWFGAKRGWRRWALAASMALIAAGLFFSLSRGAWLGAMCGIFTLLVLRRQFQIVARLSIVLIPLVIICWNVLPTDAREYVTGFDRSENLNIRARYDSVEIAWKYFEQSPWIGAGAGLRKEYDATNLLGLTLAETGLLGMVALGYLHVAVLQMVWRLHTSLPRNSILFSVVALSGALVLSKFIHGMVDIYWSRGAIMITWASVGMATSAYFLLRRQRRLLAVQAARAALALEQPVESARPVLA